MDQIGLVHKVMSYSLHPLFLFYFFFTLGHDFLICWITFHFQEFQSVVIGKKNKNRFGSKSHPSALFSSVQIVFISDMLHFI